MTHFHGLCHGKCALRYVGGILRHRKLDFRGLKGQFDVKKANFRGLIAKIGHLRPILASITYIWPICMDYVTGNVP
jgi:hypothetical protein